MRLNQVEKGRESWQKLRQLKAGIVLTGYGGVRTPWLTVERGTTENNRDGDDDENEL